MEKISNTMTKLKGFAVATMLLAPALTWAQSTSSVIINVTNEMIKTQADGVKAIDLEAEVKKQNAAAVVNGIELQMLRVQAKAGIGGAQLFLKINQDYVASAVVETDPDLFSSADGRGYESFELKNIDRSKVNSALLQLQNSANLKVRTIEVILGAVQETVIFGRYAQDQAAVIGGIDDSDSRDMRPTDAAVAAIYGTYYGAGSDSAAALQLAQEAARQKAQADAVLKAEQDRLAQVQAQQQYLNQLQAAEQERLRRQEEYYAELRRQENEARYGRQQQVQTPVFREEQQPQTRGDQCVKAKKKKITGRKQICVGEVIYGVPSWNGHNPKVIAVNESSRTITVLFDYSSQPVSFGVDSLPDAN